jgi:galactose mutarotase-like enzyme
MNTRPIPDKAAEKTGPSEFTLATPEIEVVVAPALGGRIVRLRDRTAAAEWMWSNPHLSPCVPSFDQSYVETLDAGGWDEILPTVEPCRIMTPAGEKMLPDHGDLVRLPCEVVAAGPDKLETETTGRSLPFVFRRRMRVTGRQVQLDYLLRNEGTYAFPWMWCSHPLIPFDTTVVVETDAVFRVAYASGAAAPLLGKAIGWTDLPPRSERWAAKLFSSREALNRILVRRTSGTALEFHWNPATIPFVGVWVNNGGWSGSGSPPYHNLGIEPATLPIDKLAEAFDAPSLAPGESHRWSLSVTLLP